MALGLEKLSKKLDFKGSGTSYNKSGFQTQTVTKYLRLALVLRWNSQLWEKIIAIFWTFFASINRIFIFAGRLGTSPSFYKV